MAASDDAVVVVMLRTDQPNARRRVNAILAAMEPAGSAPVPAQVTSKPVTELVAADHDRLSAIFGRDAVDRLGVGSVVAPAGEESGTDDD